MQDQQFVAPGFGVWERNKTHAPRPMTKYHQQTFIDGFIRGFSKGSSEYGLLVKYLEPQYVNGFVYLKPVIVGAPKNSKGGHPPKFLFKLLCQFHPEIRRRLKTASKVFQTKPWLEHIRHWDKVLKPQSLEKHKRLQSVDVIHLSDVDLTQHLTDCFENSKEMFFQHHLYTISCFIPVGDYIARTQAWTGLSPSEIAEALQGSTPLSSGITEEYKAALHAIGGDRKAQEILESQMEPGKILKLLQDLPGQTGQAVRDYLELVSNHIIGGYDITCLRAIEVPGIIVRGLQGSYSQEDQAIREKKVSDRIERIRLRVPEDNRSEFDEILADARLVSRLRDERDYWSDLWASGLSRRALLEVGRRLLTKGAIKRVEHVLEASYEETMALFTGIGVVFAPSPEDLENRWFYRTTISSDAAPQFLGGSRTPPPPPTSWFPKEAQRTMVAFQASFANLFAVSDQLNDANCVRGLSVSSGQFEGIACVVSRIEDLYLLKKGEILVTEGTSASFNVALPLVGAIVTDRGGVLSHAAIVAREYGIPGVVGCRNATTTIPNGAMIRVDADKGEVTILS